MTVKQLIVALLAVSTLLACLLIWPVGAMKDTVVSSSGAENNQRTEVITEQLTVSQTFIPQYDYIRSIGILLDRDNGNSYIGDFILEIIDSAGQRQRKVFSKINIMNDMSNGYQELRVNLKVIAGTPYIIQISTAHTQGQPIRLIYRTKNGAGPIENQLLYYDGHEMPNASLACSYTYGSSMGKKQILVYDLFFIALFFLMSALLDKLAKHYEILNRKIDFLILVRCLVTTLLGWILVFSTYYIFIRKAFGGSSWDFIVYGIALILLAFVEIYIVWHAEMPHKSQWTDRNFPIVVRVIAFAVYFSLYAPYFNSGSNYGHYLNGCYMSIAFAIVVLSLFTIRQLYNWKTIAISIVYWCGCGTEFLYRVHQLSGEQRVLRLWAYFGGWLWAIVILVTICNFCKKHIRRIVIPYAVVIFSFFVLCWVFRYEKYWPIYITVCFGLLYLQDRDMSQTIRLLRNFCQGAILSFWYEVFFCILHRPYHRYVYSRYPMQFSSVAMTGLYLLFVFTAVILLTVERYRTSPALKNMWFYYLTLGSVMSYIFLSVSRTALMGTAVIILGVLVLLYSIWFRRMFKRIVQIMGILFLCFFFTLPITYTLTRCVPAVVDDPVMYPYEEFGDRINQGEEKDSYRYMNVRGLLELTMGRLMVTLEGDKKTGGGQEDENIFAGNFSETETNDAAGEVTNGRLDIFSIYLKQLNLTGHESMVITVDDTIYAHAHNTFIQVFYDHGVFCGLIFICLGVFTFIRSILYIIQNKTKGFMVTAPLIFLLSFAIAGMTEWVFQPVIPLGFGVLFMIYPLLSPIKKQSQE